MSRLQLLLFLTALPLVLSVSPLSVPFRGQRAFYRPSSSRVGDDPGSPVYLTPYIKAGKTDQGIFQQIYFNPGQIAVSLPVRQLLTQGLIRGGGGGGGGWMEWLATPLSLAHSRGSHRNMPCTSTCDGDQSF